MSGWHREEIKAALRIKFGKLEHLSVRWGYHKSAIAVALNPSHRIVEIERRIALALQVPPHIIWPERWDASGFPIKNLKIEPPSLESVQPGVEKFSNIESIEENYTPVSKRNQQNLEGNRRRLQVRMAALDRLGKLVDSGHRKMVAVSLVAKEFNVSQSQIYEWSKIVRGEQKSKWAQLLIPKYGGGRQKVSCSPEAFAYLIETYDNLQYKSFEKCFQLLCIEAIKRNWTIPSSRTLQRRFNNWRLERSRVK